REQGVSSALTRSRATNLVAHRTTRGARQFQLLTAGKLWVQLFRGFGRIHGWRYSRRRTFRGLRWRKRLPSQSEFWKRAESTARFQHVDRRCHTVYFATYIGDAGRRVWIQ